MNASAEILEGMINPAMRTVEVRDAMSACLITGTEKIKCGYGNGDCLLIDFPNRVFAVADATERFSSASRLLLTRLYESYSSNRPSTPDEWHECVTRIYGSQEYMCKTTFSCIIIREAPCGELTGFVLSGGDSMVLVTDHAGVAVYETRPNMNFAGRSRHIGELFQVDLKHGQGKVVLYSDGLADVVKNIPQKNARFTLPDEYLSAPVHTVASDILRGISDVSVSYEYDDVGFIMLNPRNTISHNGDVIIMGGTTPIEEMRYQKLGKSDWSNKTMPLNKWGEHDDVLLRSGISVHR